LTTRRSMNENGLAESVTERCQVTGIGHV